jgi:hypothetical protein
MSQSLSVKETWEMETSKIYDSRVESIAPATTLMANLPISPGVGARRKGPKSLPTLPLSAFSAPNTGISDSFPLPPSPSTVHPDRVVDASVRGSILEWKEQTSGALAGRVGAVVMKASDTELEGFVRASVTTIFPSFFVFFCFAFLFYFLFQSCSVLIDVL